MSNYCYEPHLSCVLDVLLRNLTENLTVGPTLSVKPEHIKAHIESILTIPGSKVSFNLVAQGLESRV